MAANNYYGLPQVPERIRFTVETLTKGCTRAANGGAVHCSSNCLPRPGTWHSSACWLQCCSCCLCCHLLCSSSASGTKCAACCLFGLSSGRTHRRSSSDRSRIPHNFVSRLLQHMQRPPHLQPPSLQRQLIPTRRSMLQPLACQQQPLVLLQLQQLIIRKLLWRRVSPTLRGTRPTTRPDPRTATPMPKWLPWRHDSR